MRGPDWTRRARAELDGQLAWLAERNPSAASRLAAEVARAVALMTSQPGLGYRGHRPDVRIFLTRRHRYRIVYQPTSSGLTILRFLHPRQSGP